LAAAHEVSPEAVRAYHERAENARQVAAVPSAVLDEYVGTYRVNSTLSLDITRDGGRLLVSWGGRATYSLQPRSESEFFFRLLDASVTFVRSEDVTVTHLVLEQGGERSVAHRELK
jgi:serine-type D-Ala-D-Ala carboxypeptidase/endopeptidase